MADQRTLVAIACTGAGAVDTLALDPTTGELEQLASAKGLDGVAALAFGSDRTLYAACNGSPPRVVGLALDQTGTAEEGPARELPASTCFISLAPSGRELYSASYGQDRLDRVPLPGAGDVVATYSTGHNTHCAAVSPDGRFLYATSLGDDRILWCPADVGGPVAAAAAAGAIGPSGHVATESGSGPRYIRFNAAGDRAYVIHELSGEVGVYARRPEDGRLELLQRVSAVEGLGLVPGPIRSAGIEDPGPGVVWAADLRLTPDERFLYTTERSTGTLASFAVRDEGLLEYLGRIETETQPCSAAVDPSGRFLLVCGEGSAHVTSYRIGDDGGLVPVSRAETSAGPLWIECRP